METDMDYGTLLTAMGRDDWEGDDATITCPCGNTIEPDAETCPEGCVNPIRAEGMI